MTIESLIAQIDEQLSQQMNNILHHKEFQKLESARQGLSYLVDNTNVSETLKIRVLNISRDELTRNLRRYRGSARDQSPVFKQIYEQEYGQFGGEPFGCIIGDFEFDHSPMSVTLLTELAKISAASHCPFISAASPSLLQMSKWNELGNPRDIGKIFTTPEYASSAPPARKQRFALSGADHAAFPVAFALRCEDQPDRRVRFRGGRQAGYG